MASTCAKRACERRFSPAGARTAELSRACGRVRKVYNMALAARTAAWAQQERADRDRTPAMLTEWRKTDEPALPDEGSSVRLRPALRHPREAFTNCFAQRAEYPRSESRKRSRRSAGHTRRAFRFRDGSLTPAKTGRPLDAVRSRPLPERAHPTAVAVPQDGAGRGVAWPEFRSLPGYDAAAGDLPAAGRAVTVRGAGAGPQRRAPVGRPVPRRKAPGREP
ncbi:helix-turn-helix domain-containing protein [Streptomyces sp. WG5]|uniref:helix-turn-helix domain-containing protein n=1 Tax=Streptomyces sp. WG5 TaxID=3417648 RepID=UPI003CE8068F